MVNTPSGEDENLMSDAEWAEKCDAFRGLVEELYEAVREKHGFPEDEMSDESAQIDEEQAGILVECDSLLKAGGKKPTGYMARHILVGSTSIAGDERLPFDVEEGSDFSVEGFVKEKLAQIRKEIEDNKAGHEGTQLPTPPGGDESI